MSILHRLKKYRRFILSLSFALSCLFLGPSQCSAESALTQAELTVLCQQLETQETVLTEALSALEKAQESLIASETELEISREELTALRYDLAQAQEELKMQKAETLKLKTLLNEQRQELLIASASIRNAEQYVNEAKEEWLKQDKDHRQKENALRGERALWQIIAVILGGVAIGK